MLVSRLKCIGPPFWRIYVNHSLKKIKKKKKKKKKMQMFACECIFCLPFNHPVTAIGPNGDGSAA